jgi:hypothetical protein
MTHPAELADIEWLTGREAGAILDDLAEDEAPLHTAADRLRKILSAARSHLVLEQVELRRRGAAKFTGAAQLFFTRTGLEQATDEWVARYKAERFEAGGPVADLCCGIGGDLMAFARRGAALGVDRDPVSAHFAAVNSGAAVQVLDVGEFGFESMAAWHIDPDRRSSGRRTTSLEFFEPNREAIEQMLLRGLNAAVKLAPGTKPPAEWQDRCEFEWISRDGECKQLVAWQGELAKAAGLRRATVLSARDGKAVRSVIGLPDQLIPVVEKPDRFVFDVDPALTAARLTGVLAAERELRCLDHGPTYLTGSQAIDDAAMACFEVLEVLPLRIRSLAQVLRARGVGRLEIKKRGVDIDPESLRRDLQPRGSNAMTLVITPVAGRPTVILAERVE